MLRKIGDQASYRRLVRVASLIIVCLALGTGGALAQAGGSRSSADEQRVAAQPPISQATPARTPTSPGEAVPAQNPGYRLGSGDKVRITVFGQPDLSGEYFVDGTGTISFPLIGPVHAGGLTANEVARAIVSKLKPDYIKDPKVSVAVLDYRPFYILGEVKKPGSYPYVSGMSVVNGVALAGGYTYRARDDSFYIDRMMKDGKRERIDATPDTPVDPGDVMTVRERYF